jgi:hypothetical protein
MPIDNLKDMKSILTPSFFVTYLTVQPDRDSINEYVRQMEDELDIILSCGLRAG